MGAVLSTPAGMLVVAVLVVGLYAAYRIALPKPIPGIPYNLDAAGKWLGDVPEMMSYVLRTKRIFCWLTSLTARHQSPIVQVFIKPMSHPWVVLTDPLESQDILLRRKEFDRSGIFGELTSGVLPEQHAQYLSADIRFKNNRSLINHLMAPTFIKEVLGPELFKSVSALIKLWQVKCDMAKGRPFEASVDLTYTSLDAIFASLFGHPEAESIISSRLQAVTRSKKLEVARKDGGDKNLDQPVQFPDSDIPEVFAATVTLAHSISDTQLSPFPRFTSWALSKFPYMRKAAAIKDKYIRAKIEEAVSLIKNRSGDDDDDSGGRPRTAMHSVLLREKEIAAKEGRPPEYRKRAILDEFFGLTLAGYDTSATSVSWGIKLLTDNPAPQNRLRAELRAALPDAAAEKRAPTYQELASLHLPYLDAVIEEILRHANTIAFVVRRALRDTTVLGHRIPKGTDVFLMANGAGYLEPNMQVRNDGTESRSPGATPGQGKSLTGLWDDEDIAVFRPERWLKIEKDTGAEGFDPMAGPSLAFGLGSRSCFGRKFALHELKIQFALIVWHFNLLPTPSELGGYEAVQKFAREPIKCYVRLSNVDV